MTAEKRAGGIDAIRLDPADTVATVLRAIAPGQRVAVGGAQPMTLVAAEDIPFCHKISLAALEAGGRIVKYGEAIGEATVPVRAGAHVHVHNMRSLRARASNQ